MPDVVVRLLLVARNSLALALRARELIAALKSMRSQDVLPLTDHLALTADGLLNASRNSTDGGYSICYSLLLDWQRGYVETTGYIIPTMLNLTDVLDRSELRTDALKNGEWLLRHQLEDGAFPEISRSRAAIFDTGQVLIGLQRLHAETKDERYKTAASRAARWLFDQFAVASRSGNYREPRCPTYVTRSAAALIDFGVIYGHPEYVEAGRGFLNWAAQQILPSGLFRYSQLGADRDYLLHTVVYVLEGFLHAHAVLGERRWLDVALQGAEPLKKINLEREVVLRSYYAADLSPCSHENCPAGLSQWAGVCLRLFELTGDEGYRACASNSLYYVKSKQMRSRGQLRGALPGSVPVWGRYHKLSFPSWNLKFFGDALLKWRALELDDRNQQEVFVGSSHAISAGAVGWTSHADEMTDFDNRVIALIDAAFARMSPRADGRLDILDLGCGEGRFLKQLRRRRAAWRVVGIDPIPPRVADPAISQGTAREIPFADASFDGVYATIAFQHVDNVKAALAEVARVLRPGGVFVVFDRNLISIRGLLKPWHEIRGRWLYSWDSPFRERWYTRRRWTALLRGAGFRRVEGRAMTHTTGRGLRGVLPINRFVLVAGQKP